MSSLLQPLRLLLIMFAGWINRHQLDLIDYIQEENRLLKERLGGQRIRFPDAERQRLARKAFTLGRKALNELQTLVTPDWDMRSGAAPSPTSSVSTASSLLLSSMVDFSESPLEMPDRYGLSERSRRIHSGDSSPITFYSSPTSPPDQSTSPASPASRQSLDDADRA